MTLGCHQEYRNEHNVVSCPQAFYCPFRESATIGYYNLHILLRIFYPHDFSEIIAKSFRLMEKCKLLCALDSLHTGFPWTSVLG